MRNDRIWIQLVDEPIDQESLRDKVADPDVGAHGWFVGVTRRTTDQRVTNTLAYEAHRPMAIRELEKLAEAALERFSLCRIVIVHRLGEVPVGEASVVVGCSSGHRPQTFQALAWVMDTLKREVPIWKRETYVDGTAEWVHPTAGVSSSEVHE
jgi:molybdopterin synthase catalytic subunit